METVLITGGTGLIGKALTHLLIKKNYQVIILTRKLPSTQQTAANISYALWNIEEKKIDTQAIQKADHIIDLDGAGVVDKRWNRAYKNEKLDSGIKTSGLLIQA